LEKSVTDQEGVERAASEEGSEDFGAGVTLVITGLVMLFVWQFILNFIVLGGGKKTYDVCLSAVDGPLLNMDRWAFPTQIWCETEGNAYAGAVYPVWQSVGFSSVTVILVAVMLYGVWVMVRRDTSAPQRKP
jgi:hypothetical protein